MHTNKQKDRQTDRYIKKITKSEQTRRQTDIKIYKHINRRTDKLEIDKSKTDRLTDNHILLQNDKNTKLYSEH